MTKKQLSIFILVGAIAIFPLLVGAESKTLSKEITQVKSKLENNKEVKKKLKDIRDEATSTASSTKKQENRNGTTTNENKANESKTRTIQATNNIIQKTVREIARVKNIIDRLTNSNSIIAKLETNNVNTAVIKAKLDSARAFIVKVETDIQTAKDIIASTATSTTPNIKTKIVGVRKVLGQASSNLKSAINKIKEANKLIKEIPGIRKIEQEDLKRDDNKTSTSTATTTKSN